MTQHGHGSPLATHAFHTTRKSPTVLGAVAAHSLDGLGHCDSAALRSSHVFSRSPSWDRAAA